jgi:hypothetical protein
MPSVDVTDYKRLNREAEELWDARAAAGKPKPDPKALIPHPEDFAAWCEHPITRFMATAWQRGAELQQLAWVETSWRKGNADPLELNTLRTRADAYMAFLETGLNDYAKLIEKA